MKSDRSLILFTDLDGTLLDHSTYSPAEAEAALAETRQCGVPVIFCSSKTRAEIERLRERLIVCDPFIVENGGAVIIPDGYFSDASISAPSVIELGAPYQRLVAALRLLRAETGLRMVGFSDLTTAEVAARTHLTLAEASLAKGREYDEPFLLLDDTDSAIESLRVAVERAGLRLTRGGRFYHLHGRSDKGEAVRRLTDLYRLERGEVETAALGDSENDLPMFAAVDRPMLVRRRDGSYDATVRRTLPEIELIDGIGPQGWALAVTTLLADKRAKAESAEMLTRRP